MKQEKTISMVRKTVAWLLCLTMVFLSLPSAASLSPDEIGNPSVTDLPIEETEKRTAETKTFLMPDGTHTFRSYGTLVHKPAPDGTWAEIDNRLIKDGETGGFVTADGLETVHFAADTPAVSVETEKGKLSWTVAPYEGESLEKALASVTDVTDTAWYKSSSPEEQAMVAAKLDGAISYAFPERSLRVDYSVSPGTVKENFVLLAPADGRFKLTLSGLTAEQKEQTVSLFNEEGEELFVISAPYIETAY